MTSVTKHERVVSALHDLTERGALAWEEFVPEGEPIAETPPAPQDGPIFVTFHRGIDLYLWRDKEGGADTGVSDSDSYSTCLKVVDPETGAGWEFPSLEELSTLYDLVEFRMSGLEEWMSQVINETAREETEENLTDDMGATQSSDNAAPSWVSEDREHSERPLVEQESVQTSSSESSIPNDEKTDTSTTSEDSPTTGHDVH